MAAEAEAAREARAKVISIRYNPPMCPAASHLNQGPKIFLLLRLLRPRGSRRRVRLSRRPVRSCPRTPPPCSSDTFRSGIWKSSMNDEIDTDWFQTLSGISAEKNSTVIFPIPIDMIKKYLN